MSATEPDSAAPREPIQGVFPLAIETGYRLCLPESAPPRGGHPLVLALHGHSQSGEQLLGRLPVLGRGAYAALVPDAPYPLVVREAEPPRVGYSWYQFTGDQDAFLRSMDRTIGHLDRLLEHLASLHPIDGSRVVLLGYSQGGYLAGFMALRDPGRFRGLVAIATRVKVEAPGARLDRLRGFPVLAIHGRNDEAVRLAPQEKALDALRAHGAKVEVVLHDAGHRLRREDGGAIDEFVKRALAVEDEDGPA